MRVPHDSSILRHTTRAAATLLSIVGCKIEPVLERQATPEAAPAWEIGAVVPWAEDRDDEALALRNTLRRELATLTSPQLQARRPGTEGATLTAEHLERSMRSYGLVPAGLGGGWRQPTVVRLREVASARLVLADDAALPDAVALSHPADLVVWYDGDDAWRETLTLLDIGHGVRAPQPGPDDYAGVDVRGKLLLARDGVDDTAEWTDDARALHGARAHKLELARAAGARGLLLETSSLCTDPSWTALVAELGGPHVDVPTDTRRRKLAPIEGALCVESGAKLRAWLSADDASPASGRKVVLDGEATRRMVVDPNVVGRIPGALRPEEVVLLLAHWDAGGVAPARANGGAAIDNAAGVAALLAVADASATRVARGQAPARTIAFAATASDTLDLLGATALFGDGPFHRAQLVAVVSLDVLIPTGGSPLVAIGSDGDLSARLSNLGVEQATAPSAAPHPRLAHEVAIARGIPAVTLTRHDGGAVADGGPMTEPPSSLVHDADRVLDLIWGLADAEPGVDVAPTTVTSPAPE